jgi:hypothetical protein
MAVEEGQGVEGALEQRTVKRITVENTISV